MLPNPAASRHHVPLDTLRCPAALTELSLELAKQRQPERPFAGKSASADHLSEGHFFVQLPEERRGNAKNLRPELAFSVVPLKDAVELRFLPALLLPFPDAGRSRHDCRH
jgi:hypothetical protein